MGGTRLAISHNLSTMLTWLALQAVPEPNIGDLGMVYDFLETGSRDRHEW